MNFNQFNFEHSVWLWALAFIPVMWLSFFLKKTGRKSKSRLERFADKHLLPFLVKGEGQKVQSARKKLYLWSLIWSLGTLAIAGPRWDFKEIDVFRPNKDLVILLDLSKSMDAQDTKPSRLIRAQEKIQDILEESPNVNIGLVAFAEDSHMITPITADKNAIHYLLGALRTDLVYVQGSRLSPALIMADQMLSAVPGKNKNVLVMSDGGFEDSSSALHSAKELTTHGIKINTMGFGTPEGAPVPGQGTFSKLNQDQLQLVSKTGNGLYLNALDSVDHNLFLNDVSISGETLNPSAGKTKDWEPRFYIFIIPLLLLLIPFFRRLNSNTGKNILKKVAAAVVTAFFILPHQARAQEPSLKVGVQGPKALKLFKNQDTLGKEALEAQDYGTAIKRFDDPYRKGVAEYKAGEFEKAEQSFRGTNRPDVKLASKYNLGNALAQEGKYEEAIKTYESVLKDQPNHHPAKINLKIVQDLLKKKNDEQSKNQNQNKGQGEDKNQAQDKTQSQNGGQVQNKEQGQVKDQSQNNNQGRAQSQKNDQGQKEGEKIGEGQNSKQAKGPSQNKDNGQAANQSQGKEQEQSKGQTPGQPNDRSVSGKPGQEHADNQGAGKNPAENKQENQKQGQTSEETHKDNQKYDQKVSKKYQQDIDADLWLNRITSDPHAFLKNQFLIESSRLQTSKGYQQ